MKKYWNIVYPTSEEIVYQQKPIYGTREQAQAFLECTYDSNNMKIKEVEPIDLDNLKQKCNGLIHSVWHKAEHIFTYHLGPHNHNKIKDLDTGSFDALVEKDYFNALNL